MTPSPGIRTAITFGRRCQLGAAGLIVVSLVVAGLVVVDPAFTVAALSPPGLVARLIPVVALIVLASWSARRRARRQTTVRLRRMRMQWTDLDQQWRDHGRGGNGADGRVERARLRRQMAALRPAFAQTLADARALGLS